MTAPRPFLIGGKWKHTEVVEPVTNPFDGRVIAEICQAGTTEVAEALASAESAFAL